MILLNLTAVPQMALEGVSLQLLGERGGSFNICIPDGKIKTQWVKCWSNQFISNPSQSGY